MRWSVAGNYQPQIATVDGVTIATSDSGATVMFDANGVAVGQIAALPTQSWLGHTYRVGSTDMVAAALVLPDDWSLGVPAGESIAYAYRNRPTLWTT